MKNSICKLIVIALMQLSYASCSDNNHDPNPPYNNSYIQKFTDVEQITASTNYGITINETDKIVYFETDNADTKDGFYLSLEAKSSNGFYAADAPKESAAYKGYLKYINLIGDTNFKLSDRYYGVLSNHSIAITDTLMSIVVTCDKSFSSEVPANTSLNHLISVFFDNPYKVVKNSYNNYNGNDSYLAKTKTKDKVENIMIKDFPYAFVGDKLSEIEWKSKPFIGNKWILVFNQKPDLTGIYTFKIEITNKRGNVIEVFTQAIELQGKESE